MRPESPVVRLTEEQEAAVAALEGPVRVVAGAGTGKTAVIAGRYRRLLEAGAEPAQILVMTFTERAAADMHARILADAGMAAAPHVGTFHSLAMRWLRDEGRRVGVPPDFRILAGPEQWIVMRGLMWELGDPALIGVDRPDDMVLPLLKLLERARQELVPPPRLRAWVSRVEDPERRAALTAALRLFKAYRAHCRRDRVLDFDELLVKAVRLLEENPDVRARFSARFRWVLVDEYQDTNLAQERVVELIAGPAGNVCVVGDDDQSIYRFRGASRASMDRFLTSFPTAATLQLGRNRRSSRRIVAAARRLIEQNRERLDKPLASDPEREEGPPVEVWRCATAEQEAALIAAEAGAAHAAGVPLRRIAVLARTHAIARPVAAALARAGVPFQHLAGQGLFQRPEVRDLVAYLRLLHDPTDLVALSRLLVRPPLRLDLSGVLAWLRADQAPAAPLLALRAREPTARWAALIVELSALKAVLGVDDLLFELLSRTRHLDLLLAGLSDAIEARRVAANVGRFAELVSEYCERRRDHSLGRFVEHLDLVLRSGLDEEVAELEDLPDAVQLMTIHQAKGLEFGLVFVPALAEGRLPQPRRRDEVSVVAGLELPAQLLEPAVRGREDQLAEERRLCYVAATRARDRLVLTWADRYEGERAWRRSRFLDELGPGVAERDRRLDVAGGVHPLSTQVPDSAGVADRWAPPDPLGGERVALSFSAISAYRECPRQHWYRYHLRLPAQPTDEAHLGTVVHLALLRAGRLRRDGATLTREALGELHREAWEAAALVEPRRRPALETLGWRLLERFFDAGGLDAAPWLLEAPFDVAVDGWSLRGVIDRVDGPRQAGGPWRIVDYKTGNPLPASRLRRDLQLALYALGARMALGLDPVELEIVYLRDGARVAVEAGQELLSDAREIAGAVAAGVSAGRFEPRPERRRCGRCPYRLACEAAL